MALLQISEPGQSAAPHQHRVSVGIDLGTTNSLVATVRSGEAVCLADEEGRNLLPSVVHFASSGILVGHEAAILQNSDPLNSIASIKRLMGRGQEDVPQLDDVMPYEFVTRADSRVPRIHTRGGDLSAVEISAEILRVLAQRARQSINSELDGVVITVPAYFDDAQRQATRDAATLAGLNLFRLLNEPTAAAVAYGLDQKTDGLIAVFDLGGGTFDISLLHLKKGVFEVLATGGDSSLGGDDMDHALGEWIIAEAGFSDVDTGLARRILLAARAAKEELTSAESTRITIDDRQHQWSATISRECFDELIRGLVAKTLTACRRALRDAGVNKSGIDEVVMVGGSTRVPLVQSMVAGCAAPVPGHRDHGWPERENNFAQHGYSGGACTGVHDLQGWPDGHVYPRGAGRTRTCFRLPLAGAIRAARVSADDRRRRAYTCYLPGGRRWTHVGYCRRTHQRDSGGYRGQTLLRPDRF